MVKIADKGILWLWWLFRYVKKDLKEMKIAFMKWTKEVSVLA